MRLTGWLGQERRKQPRTQVRIVFRTNSQACLPSLHMGSPQKSKCWWDLFKPEDMYLQAVGGHSSWRVEGSVPAWRMGSFSNGLRHGHSHSRAALDFLFRSVFAAQKVLRTAEKLMCMGKKTIDSESLWKQENLNNVASLARCDLWLVIRLSESKTWFFLFPFFFLSEVVLLCSSGWPKISKYQTDFPLTILLP